MQSMLWLVVSGTLKGPCLPPPAAALVDCVAQLGGLHDAQQALRRHMPHQLRLVVSKALDCFPASQRLPPGVYMQQHLQHQQQQQAAASPSGQADISVPPEVAATAQAQLEHILGCCSQVG